MDCPGSHVTKRYRPALAGSDEVFADYSFSEALHPTRVPRLFGTSVGRTPNHGITGHRLTGVQISWKPVGVELKAKDLRC